MRPLPVPASASSLAPIVGGQLHGPDLLVQGVASLDASGDGLLAFNERGAAGAAPVQLARQPQAGRTTLVVADPLAAFALLLGQWFPEWRPERGAPAIHPSAAVHPSAVVHPGVVIGPDVEVGEGCVLFPNVVLYPRTRLGARVRVHAGAVIGADGFRYHPQPSGLLKVPHVGGVRVGNDAEIGANTCIDRGMLADTVVGPGAKIDNLVQVGHNCELGAYSILVSQVGLSGSVRVGAGAILAGQVGVKDHVSIGAGARLGARSAVHTDVPAGETWLGEPARPVREAMRVYAALKYLPELVRKVGR